MLLKYISDIHGTPVEAGVSQHAGKFLARLTDERAAVEGFSIAGRFAN